MYLLSSHLLGIASAARDRAIEIGKSNPGANPSDATVAIILSAAATEGFINESSAFIRKVGESAGARSYYNVTPQQAAFSAVLKELEEGRASVKAKYIAASWFLQGKPFNEGENPFQDFALLIKLRDAHMHLKLRDDVHFKDGELISKSPDYFKEAYNRGLVRKYEGNYAITSWLNSLQTPEMAEWAVVTARNIIHAVLDMAPDSERHFEDPWEVFKMNFRSSQHPRPWD